jgi:hypothetical protein
MSNVSTICGSKITKKQRAEKETERVGVFKRDSIYTHVCMCLCVTKEKKIESNFSTICGSKITKKQRAERE